MKRLIRTELLKQRTTPVFLLAFAAVPVLALLVTVAVYGAAGNQGNPALGTDSLVQALGAPASVVTTLALLLGVVGMGGEYRHQTITTTLLMAPRRRDVVVAKLAAFALMGAAMALVTTAVAAAVAVPWLHSAGVPVHFGADALRVSVGLLLSTALYAALGVAVASLLRNQTAAVSVVLVWILTAERLLGNVLGGASVVDWLPARLASALVQLGPGARPTVAVALGLAAWVGAFAAIGTRFVVRRDVT